MKRHLHLLTLAGLLSCWFTSKVNASCVDDTCGNTTYPCPAASDCTVECSSDDSCGQLTVIAPSGFTLGVTCTGAYSCDGLEIQGLSDTTEIVVSCESAEACQGRNDTDIGIIINGNGTEEIIFYCEEYSCNSPIFIDAINSDKLTIRTSNAASSRLKDAEFYCPDNQFNKQSDKACIFRSLAQASDGSHSDVSFYTVEGLAKDLRIICNQDQDCFGSNVTLFCDQNNYASSCAIQQVYDSSVQESRIECDQISGPNKCQEYVLYTTDAPSEMPSTKPTFQPSSYPTQATIGPSKVPSRTPTSTPTAPSSSPTSFPSKYPSNEPTILPSNIPSTDPTANPSNVPTDAPSYVPTDSPSNAPTGAPTSVPTDSPSAAPTIAPTDAPSIVPTEAPSNAPTTAPTDTPSDAPTTVPTTVPTSDPSLSPTSAPIVKTKSNTQPEDDAGATVGIVFGVLIGIILLVLCIFGAYVFNVSKSDQYADEQKYQTFQDRFQAAASDTIEKMREYKTAKLAQLNSSSKGGGGQVEITHTKPVMANDTTNSNVDGNNQTGDQNGRDRGTSEKHLYTEEEEEDMKQEEYVTPGGPDDGPDVDNIDLEESEEDNIPNPNNFNPNANYGQQQYSNDLAVSSNQNNNNNNNNYSNNNSNAMYYGGVSNNVSSNVNNNDNNNNNSSSVNKASTLSTEEEDTRLALQLSQAEIYKAIQRQNQKK